ncbi:hypothetical protein MSG28_011514 [Choristoneura fumiferana]|uniref:Uncharacterized protein n=1 Tax=Choristoneura fumiferana TaxID=7141 RepID=A0ACC0JNI2_CHOFU|nr:hypothetical protein MSG28_011514 [Choristoneura fumiferana]
MVSQQGNDHGVGTTIENMEQTHEAQLQDDGSYLIEQPGTELEEDDVMEEEYAWSRDKWTDEETKRLLVFYVDNKAAFQAGSTRKKHLWTVACKTMLSSKQHNSCEMKLRNLKRKYLQLRVEQEKGFNAFHDDKFVNDAVECSRRNSQTKAISIPTIKPNDDKGIVIVKKVNKNTGDSNVEAMLTLYLKNKGLNYKSKQKALWQSIAMQLGVEDGDYWHKRFLNFKNNYIRLLEKRNSEGPESISWPYMHLFDQIYEGDEDFQKRHGPQQAQVAQPVTRVYQPIQQVKPETFDHIWNATELLVLVKYYFDCYQEFHDKTIPNSFLWNEVGRLIDKSPDSCKAKFEELRKEHLKKYLEGGYELRTRAPLAILFDNIISKDVQHEILTKTVKSVEMWKTEELDEVVQFCYENAEDDESYDERGFMKRSKRRTGDSKSFKILEFYQKNKEKFASPNRKKLALWEILARDIGMSAAQCAHRFRNLKQVYTKYVQREINKPEKPILWPYYAHCKKVFGYRAIKSKLRNGKRDTDDEEEWSAKEIKQLINYFAQNFDDINSNVEDKNKWSALAAEIGKVEDACCEKLLELRKSYRKLKTMKTRNADVKISWKYFNLFDEIYTSKEDVETVQEIEMNGDAYEELDLANVKMEAQDDDFQCIIVIPEGQEIGDMSNAQIIMTENGEMQPYLQQSFDIETGKLAGEDTVFTDILKEITSKESTLKNDIQNEPKPVIVEPNQDQEDCWTDAETEQLLSWYLANLEKFKNPKFESISKL